MTNTLRGKGRLIAQGAKGSSIYIFTFQTANGNLDLSVFNPTKPEDLPLPRIENDWEYEFGYTVKESQGRTFNNMAKKWRGKTPYAYDVIAIGNTYQKGAPDYTEPGIGKPQTGGQSAAQRTAPQPQVTNNFAQKDNYWKEKEERDIARYAKLDAEQPIKEWSMKRGGYSHDAATITAAIVGAIKEEDALQLAKAAADIQITITDKLVAAAEAREKDFRAKMEMGSLKADEPDPGEKEESVLANEGGEPNTKRVKQA